MRIFTKRRVVTFLIIVICFLLQGTVFQKMKLAAICPNLMVIVTAAFGFMKGKRTGMNVGVVCGIFFDLFWGSSLGFYMLVFVIVGYISGMFQKLFYDEDIKLPIVVVSVCEIVYGLFTYVGLFMLQGDFSFLNYFFHIIIPELVYTILMTLVMYQILLHINNWLENEEQRSESKFV